MKLLVEKIAAEFNKIFAGTKRVGDSLRLEGKRMTDLDVKNASTLGNKTESSLNVRTAVNATNSEKIRAVDDAGNPVVDQNGNAVFKYENTLNVNSAKKVNNVDPLNMEVKTASDLRFSPTIIVSVSSLFDNPQVYRVKDSLKLGGKLENELYVNKAVTADNSLLLGGKAEGTLKVLESTKSTFMKTDDGLELKEQDLRVKSATLLKNGTDTYNLYQLRDYLFSTDQARAVYVTKSAESATISTPAGSKDWASIITFLKNDTSSEIYKTSRIITVDGIKTGDDYKGWIIGHNDFSTKVGTLNANTSNRAERFGSNTENYDIAGMKTLIKGTTVDNASNSAKLLNNTVDDIINTTRSRILSSAGGTNGLTQVEVDGFFGVNMVKIAVQAIKPTNAGNADTLGGYTFTQVKDSVKTDGQVASSKVIYSDPTNVNAGTKSFIDISNLITSTVTTSKSDILGGASVNYTTLKKIEDIVIANKSAIETSLSNAITARTTADTTLQTNINTEKARIDAILSASSADKDSFAEIVTLINSIDSTNDTGFANYVSSNNTRSSTIETNLTSEITNRTNADADLQSQIDGIKSSSVSGELDKVETAVGLKNNGDYQNQTDTNYINSATTVMGAIRLVDTSLKAVDTAYKSADTTLQSNIDTEKARIDAILSLSEADKNSFAEIVTLINSVDTASDTAFGTYVTSNNTRSTTIETNLSNEVTNRTNADATLQSNIDTEKARITQEIADRESADTTLQTNITNISTKLKYVRYLITDGDGAETTYEVKLSTGDSITNYMASIFTNRGVVYVAGLKAKFGTYSFTSDDVATTITFTTAPTGSIELEVVTI